MQTFLPYADFAKSASVLDNKRLNKQITEAMQIFKLLHTHPASKKAHWLNHPCVLMWQDYPHALAHYGIAMYAEWQIRLDQGKRGGKREHKAGEYLMGLTLQYFNWPLPLWLGDPEFHASHRSNLLRKDPEWYGQFGWDEPYDLPYVWPVRKGVKDESV